MGKLRQIVEDRLIPGLERVEGGQQGSQDAVQRLDLLMRGENEANKLIDGIVPGVEKVYKMVEKLDKKFEKETEKLKSQCMMCMMTLRAQTGAWVTSWI